MSKLPDNRVLARPHNMLIGPSSYCGRTVTTRPTEGRSEKPSDTWTQGLNGPCWAPGLNLGRIDDNPRLLQFTFSCTFLSKKKNVFLYLDQLPRIVVCSRTSSQLLQVLTTNRLLFSLTQDNMTRQTKCAASAAKPDMRSSFVSPTEPNPDIRADSTYTL